MSDKVAMAVQWMVAFLSGFIIAFCYEWRLSLVIMSTSPLLAISGFLFSKVSDFSVCEVVTYFKFNYRCMPLGLQKQFIDTNSVRCGIFD